MKYIKLFFVLLSVGILMSCEKENEDLSSDFSISGYAQKGQLLNSSYKCNGIHINNLFKFFVWCEVSKSFTRSII